ncbi:MULTISPECIES: Rok-like winged helix domain-containing protein [Bacillus]
MQNQQGKTCGYEIQKETGMSILDMTTFMQGLMKYRPEV